LLLQKTWDQRQAIRGNIKSDISLAPIIFVYLQVLESARRQYAELDDIYGGLSFPRTWACRFKSFLEFSKSLMAAVGNWRRHWRRVTALCLKPAEQTTGAMLELVKVIF